MSSPSPSDSDQSPINNASAGLSGSATGEVITALVIVLFIFLVITLILYIRAKHYVGITGRPRLDFSPDPTAPNPLRRRRPLDPSILRSLPVAVFRCEPEGGVLDCAVCLSEFAEGEKARFLPECRHGFHVECIDMWFHSNSTCPLCRVQVGADEQSVHEMSVDVLEICVVGTSSGEGSSSDASSSTSEKVAMPSNPAPLERLRSVRRVWASRESDIEQGVQVEFSSTGF